MGRTRLTRITGAEKSFDELLAAAQRGEEPALGALYRRFQPDLLAYIRTQCPGAAEELAGEAWLEAARRLRRFRGDETDFRRFVFRLARQRVLERRGDGAGRSGGPAPVEALAVRGSPAAPALALVAQLPRDEAEVVILRAVAGLTAKDVAAVMERSPGAVRVLQQRALERLARLVAETSGLRSLAL